MASLPAYREPGVTVTQVFQNALPALAAFSLPNVSVGPAFQVVNQAAAGSYAASITNYSYPEQVAGTVVDLRPFDPTDLVSYPVQVNLQNTIVMLTASVATGVVLVGNLNQFTDPTSNIFANVQVGDVIVVTGSANGNNGPYTVRVVVNSNTLQTNETFAAAETALHYTLRRNVGLVNIPTTTAGVSYDADQVTLPASLTTPVANFGTPPILTASVLLSYRALRFEKSEDIFEYATITDLEADFDVTQIVPENPVIFAAFIALSNSVTATNILELGPDFFDSETIAYQEAYDVLALNDIYAISVLTQNTAVHTTLRTHVDGLSEPTEKLERVGIVNRQIVLVQTVVPALADGATDNTGLQFTSASAQFISNGVVPGMFINIASGPAAGRYLIDTVVSQTKVLLDAAVEGTNPQTALSYFVDENLTKDQQAVVLASYAQSLGDRRLVMTWPDVVAMPVGNVVRNLPGYFLNPTVGALTTGLPTQQGLTNLSVALYVGVVNSTKYFSNDQLNTIASGGVMIFVQSVLNQTPLFIRHQLTTDRSAIKFQEYSVTKNVDFIAKFIRTNHQSFIGQYNIVDSTFDDLKTNAKGIMNFLAESTRLPKIGGVIQNGQLTTIIQDPVNIDTIQETYTLTIPIPLNNLDITILV